MAELFSRPLQERQADAVSDISTRYQLRGEWARRLFNAYTSTAAGGIAACAEEWRNGSAQQQLIASGFSLTDLKYLNPYIIAQHVTGFKHIGGRSLWQRTWGRMEEEALAKAVFCLMTWLEDNDLVQPDARCLPWGFWIAVLIAMAERGFRGRSERAMQGKFDNMKRGIFSLVTPVELLQLFRDAERDKLQPSAAQQAVLLGGPGKTWCPAEDAEVVALVSGALSAGVSSWAAIHASYQAAGGRRSQDALETRYFQLRLKNHGLPALRDMEHWTPTDVSELVALVSGALAEGLASWADIYTRYQAAGGRRTQGAMQIRYMRLKTQQRLQQQHTVEQLRQLLQTLACQYGMLQPPQLSLSALPQLFLQILQQPLPQLLQTLAPWPQHLQMVQGDPQHLQMMQVHLTQLVAMEPAVQDVLAFGWVLYNWLQQRLQLLSLQECEAAQQQQQQQQLQDQCALLRHLLMQVLQQQQQAI